ncbi:MAG: NADPH-dependent glutamate synthase [Anaerolineaceae bacterium]|nr:NADPH-dependent glutamate synthase [Anaerolineaceae bacterium]
MNLQTKTLEKFIEHLKEDNLEKLSKSDLLAVYRNFGLLEEQICQVDEWQTLVQRLSDNPVCSAGAMLDHSGQDLHLGTQEVNVGVGYLEAFHKADRCLECHGMPCSTGKFEFSDEVIGGCPVLIDIPGFIKLLKEGKIFQAWMKLVEMDLLPAITGRVCPQEIQCQLSCSLAIRGEPVEIGRLERFVADYVWDNYPDEVMEYIETLREKNADGANSLHHIAVIGSGPAGLTAAIDLAILGYKVTVFESLHISGGVLAYGIPIFRLPSKVTQRELSVAKALGIRFLHNITVGNSITIPELFSQGFSAVFIGTGAGLPKFLSIPGENLKHVYSANEFLVRINLMGAFETRADTPIKVGKKVVVIGGGFTAIDAARWAKRLGAEQVTIMYRRTRREMPARLEEVENAIEEGVELSLLTNPLKVTGNGQGEVETLHCIKMELGEPDESGRRRPVPIAGSEYSVPVDTVITAIGTTPNPIILETTQGLKGTKWGTIQVNDPDTGETTLPLTYAGGDAVTGAATVILAMGAGKRVAKAINLALKEKKPDLAKLERSQVLVEECSKPYTIWQNEALVSDVYEMVVHAPVVAKYCQAGQFVLVMKERKSERIPLTIADWDREKGDITLVYQVVGKGTADLETINAGDELFAVSGPIGKPSEIKRVGGKILMVAGGVGLAAVYPILRAHHEIGNDVQLVYGARNQGLFFWLNRIRSFLPDENIFLSTDDGSLGTKGFVTDVIQEHFIGKCTVSLAVVIGPAVMMLAASKRILADGIPTIVSLNPVMLDGSAMCGGCKLSRKGGKIGPDDFACKSGPDRFANEVNLAELVSRLSTYHTEESMVLVNHIKYKLEQLLSHARVPDYGY